MMKIIYLVALLVCLQEAKAQNNKNISKEDTIPPATLSEYQRVKKPVPLITSVPKTTRDKNTTPQPKTINFIKPEATDTTKK